mmetsp:Transcript_851/g.1328  ORF Transcript_851/g.1328 Transcript_851/m.1328 type:complete len:451 (+) Transcript_851:116-1468(+)
MSFKAFLKILLAITLFAFLFGVFLYFNQNKSDPSINCVTNDYYVDPNNPNVRIENDEKTDKGGSNSENGKTEKSTDKIVENFEIFKQHGDKRLLMYTLQKNTPENVLSEWILHYIYEGVTDFVIYTDGDKIPTINDKLTKYMEKNDIKLFLLLLDDTKGKFPRNHDRAKSRHDKCFHQKETTSDGSHLGECQMWIIYYTMFKERDNKEKDPNSFVCYLDIDEYMHLDVRKGVKKNKRNFKTFLYERGYDIYWFDGMLYGMNNRVKSDEKLTIMNNYLYHSDFVTYRNPHWAMKTCLRANTNIKFADMHRLIADNSKVYLTTRHGPYWNNQRILFDHYKYLDIGKKALIKRNRDRLIKTLTIDWDVCACIDYKMERMFEIAKFFDKKVEIPKDLKKCLWCDAQLYIPNIKLMDFGPYDYYTNDEAILVEDPNSSHSPKYRLPSELEKMRNE